jgi:hypothetical protein
MGVFDWLFGSASLTRMRKGLQLMVDFHQGRQIAAEAVAKEDRHPQHHGSGQLDQLQSTLEGARSHVGSQQKTKFGGKTHPHPLATIAALFGAFSIRFGSCGSFAQNEAPQLVQFHLGPLYFSQQVLVDLIGFLRRTAQPCQTRFFAHAHGKADGRQLHFAQQQLEHNHDLLFGRAQIKKHRVPRLRKLFAALSTLEDTPFSTLGLVRRYRLDVAPVHQFIMTARRVGAWLSPFFRLSHGSSFRYLWSRRQKHSKKVDPCLFQSITG